MTYSGQPFASPGEALTHHGVKGMKWGVRNVDRPAGDRSSKPKKINTKKIARLNTQADNAQKQIDAILAKPVKLKFIQRHNAAQVKELEKFRDQRRKDVKAVSEGRMTDGQKKVLIGTAAAVTVLAAYGTYKTIDSGQAHQFLVNRAEKKAGQAFSWTKKPELAQVNGTKDIFDKIVKDINPEYGAIGTKMNCRRCTFAYELKRRGYDVRATKSVSGTGQTAAGLINATTPNSKLPTGKWGMLGSFAIGRNENVKPTMDAINISNWGRNKIDVSPIAGSPRKAESIFNALRSNPDGARGELGVGWAMGGGHSMAWEIIHGNPVVFDAQSGTQYSSAESFAKMAGAVKDAGYTRLDNLNLNDEFLKRWVNNVK